MFSRCFSKVFRGFLEFFRVWQVFSRCFVGIFLRFLRFLRVL